MTMPTISKPQAVAACIESHSDINTKVAMATDGVAFSVLALTWVRSLKRSMFRWLGEGATQQTPVAAPVVPARLLEWQIPAYIRRGGVAANSSHPGTWR
jgi:hypothetical protein